MHCHWRCRRFPAFATVFRREPARTGKIVHFRPRPKWPDRAAQNASMPTWGGHHNALCKLGAQIATYKVSACDILVASSATDKIAQRSGAIAALPDIK